MQDDLFANIRVSPTTALRGMSCVDIIYILFWLQCSDRRLLDLSLDCRANPRSVYAQQMTSMFLLWTKYGAQGTPEGEGWVLRY